ncbi:UPF0488 protein C8orf33 homolog isoform X2 [Rhipicephalus sanguineus]|uniref:UPF0488 protein C8orf33 homolog isoform X2 n=1 Tax=Rhipicephalus sanguineus TaxID=34632 RepID=UPI001895022A|nr:UPF0488 protein C8orf33 homolog isoform X2 [Rhipicephalus sanguineus]
MHRRKRLPVQKLPVPQASTSLSSEDHSNDEDANEKFERELKWCIEQLNISLSHTDAKKKNYNEELRALQTLQSVKAPVAKKRQVMSVTLGNYRAKMEQEKAKFITDSTRKTRLQPQPSAETKSVFLRKVTTADKDSQPGAPQTANEFKFNFVIDNEDT